MTDISSVGVQNVPRLEARNQQPSNQQPSLSQGQQQVISETLSRFDSANLSAADVNEVVSTFRSNNIRPSAELADFIQQQGFDVEQFAPNTANRPTPPPRQTNTNNELQGNEVFQRLTQLNGGNDGDGQIASFIEQLRNETPFGRGAVVDLFA